MTTIRVEAQITSDDLLKAVRQLSLADLDRFVQDVIALQAKAKSPGVSQTEANLLKIINQGVSADIDRRYAQLATARDAETLSPDEHAELLRLTQVFEQVATRRAEALAELARVRGIALSELMNDLSIRTPTYA